jgi:hypothetical protein
MEKKKLLEGPCFPVAYTWDKFHSLTPFLLINHKGDVKQYL